MIDFVLSVPPIFDIYVLPKQLELRDFFFILDKSVRDF